MCKYGIQWLKNTNLKGVNIEYAHLIMAYDYAYIAHAVWNMH